MSIELTEDAHKVLKEVALRWGGISKIAAIEMMLRRTGHLPPFQQGDAEPWFLPAAAKAPTKTEGEEALPEAKRELLLAMFDAAPEPENHFRDFTEMVTPDRTGGPQIAALAGLEVASSEVPVVPVDEASPAEPEPEPAALAREPREFVRAWYDDDAPLWVQLLGSDATNGLDLTAEQREALNDWQAGIDREAP